MFTGKLQILQEPHGDPLNAAPRGTMRLHEAPCIFRLKLKGLHTAPAVFEVYTGAPCGSMQLHASLDFI